MQVAEAMSTDFFALRPEETVADAARSMVEAWVGSAVLEPDRPGSPPGIFTERDAVKAVAAGVDAQSARVADHSTPEATVAAPDWSLEEAARAMTEGDFRHLPVVEGDRTVGVLSMRDVVSVWTSGGWHHRKMQIREAMSRDFLELDRTDGLRDAARLMVERNVGAAIVAPPKPRAHPEIVTSRDFLELVGAGGDPERERVSDHVSGGMTFSAPDWSLKQAAEAMSQGGFQHIVVVDRMGTVGVISLRDIVGHLLD